MSSGRSSSPPRRNVPVTTSHWSSAGTSPSIADDAHHDWRGIRGAARDLVAGELEPALLRSGHEAGQLHRGAVEARTVLLVRALTELEQAHGPGAAGSGERIEHADSGADVDARAPIDAEAAERRRCDEQEGGDRSEQQPPDPDAVRVVVIVIVAVQVGRGGVPERSHEGDHSDGRRRRCPRRRATSPSPRARTAGTCPSAQA